jgi:glycosyltransferase involved in cell wall biosynthesis
MKYRFFSFVIPAHNEAMIIEKTLRGLQELDYPKDRYEVIVVENGSSDGTYQKALAFASDNFKIISSPRKGVSRARNLGKKACSANLDWCIFMDADVFLKKKFLQELNAYLAAHQQAGYGTTTVLLDTDALIGKFWSLVNNFTYHIFKTLFTIHIVRKDLSALESYDEDLVSGEDIAYGRALARHGKYFYMKTASVFTSPRRFEKRGYLTMFFVNMLHGLSMFILPKKILRDIEWQVIR